MADIEAKEEKSAYPLRAADRVCDILDVLADAKGGVGLIEIARQCELPKSSVFRYLSALEARRYVAHDSKDGLYRLGLAFRPQNTRTIDHLLQCSNKELNNLRDKLQETVNIGVLDGSSILHIAVSESPQMMRLAARVNERSFVHSTALGKAICALLPEDLVRSMLTHSGMPRKTAGTITDVDSFVLELQMVRKSGYGMDDAENQPAGRCIAVAIPDIDVLAGISISAPLDRMPTDRIEMAVAELRPAAKRISRRMRFELPEI